ncbi:MAG: hypothetical protein HY608_08575 [Planctomycetes bacterium]|nr:hypothetical protein [Planctomycetota bacterium]
MGALFRTWRQGAIEWRSHEEDERLVRALVGDADPRTDAARWRTVQENRHRTVRRVEGHAEHASPGAYLKVVRTRGASRRLRSLFWGDQAWREWASAQEMHGRRLPVPRPLAYGRGGGSTLYLCETIPGARTLPELLASLPSASGILSRIGAFVARLHDAGASHPDLHISNLLFSGPDGTPHLLDLHSSRIRRRMKPRRRARELGVLIGSVGWLTAPDRLRIVLGYARESRYDRPRTRRFARAAWRAARGATAKHLASRTRRTLKRSSGFDRDSRDHWRAIWRAGSHLNLEMLRALVEAHREARSSSGAAVRASIRKNAPETAVTVGHDLAGTRVCVKAYRPRGLLDRLRGLVRRRRAKRAWVAAHGLAVRGVPVPEPLAVAEHGEEGFLVSREITPGRQLDTLLAERGAAWLRTPESAALLESLARLLRKGFRHGVRFGDLKGCNIVVRESPGAPPEAILTDVDGTRFHRFLPRQARLRAFLQLNTSIPRAVPLRTRVAFLRAVLRGERRATLRWFARACAQVSLTRQIVYVGAQGDVHETARQPA